MSGFGTAGRVLACDPCAPFSQLRDWLDHLHRTDRLAIARPGIDLRFEIAAIAKRMDGRQATFFPEPSGHSVPVISGLLSDRRWMAEALGVSNEELLRRVQSAVRDPIPWCETTLAPVQEVVHRNVDLPKLLPLPVHNELDSGPYITAGLLIARNPRTGVQNVTIHRLQLSGKDKLGILMLPRHTMSYYRMAEEAGEDLPVTIVVGVDPATLLSSQAIVPIDFDELKIAGALHGKPLDVVRCLSNEIRIPAHAEIAIEGRILARVREPEGPFGEFPQYYGERADQHVIQVDVVTHRLKPIFHTIVGGGMNTCYSGEFRAKRHCSRGCRAPSLTCATCTCPGVAFADTTCTCRLTRSRTAKPRTSFWLRLVRTTTSSTSTWSTVTWTSTIRQKWSGRWPHVFKEIGISSLSMKRRVRSSIHRLGPGWGPNSASMPRCHAMRRRCASCAFACRAKTRLIRLRYSAQLRTPVGEGTSMPIDPARVPIGITELKWLAHLLGPGSISASERQAI